MMPILFPVLVRRSARDTTVAATDQPLREPEIRRSQNGVLSTSLSCGYAWRNLVSWTAAADYEWGRMAESYLHLAVISSPLLLLIAAAGLTVPRALFSGAGRLLAVYFALNLANFATIAKAGAAQNYFIEPWIATVLLGALALRALGERFPRLGAQWPAVLLLCAAVANYAYPSLDRMPAALRRPENDG